MNISPVQIFLAFRKVSLISLSLFSLLIAVTFILMIIYCMFPVLFGDAIENSIGLLDRLSRITNPHQ